MGRKIQTAGQQAGCETTPKKGRGEAPVLQRAQNLRKDQGRKERKEWTVKKNPWGPTLFLESEAGNRS